MQFRVFWDVAPCGLIGVDRHFRGLMMKAVRTYETSVHSNETTRRYIPEDSKLQNEVACLKMSSGMLHRVV
jgi:hypothetical protein